MQPPARVAQPTAYLLLTTTMALWGSGLVVARAAHGFIPPMALTFWRWVVAALVLLPFVRRSLPAALPLVRLHWRAIGALTLSMACGVAFSVTAVNFTTATNATLINATQPAVTAVFAWLLVRERLSALQVCGIFLAFGGILVMVSRADPAVLAGFDVNGGDLLMLAAVSSWALYAVNLHRAASPVHGVVLLFVIACGCICVMLPFYLFETAAATPGAGGWPAVAAVMYLGGGSTVLAVYLWNLSIRSVGPNRAAIFINLMPVFGVGLATLFLGERLAGYHVAGAAFVFTGILLSIRQARAAAGRSRGEG